MSENRASAAIVGHCRFGVLLDALKELHKDPQQRAQILAWAKGRCTPANSFPVTWLNINDPSASLPLEAVMYAPRRGTQR
jgi:hypothetical protein